MGPPGKPPAGRASAAQPSGRRAGRAWLLPAGLAVVILVAVSLWWYDHNPATRAKQSRPAGAITMQTTAPAGAEGAAPLESTAPPSSQSMGIPSSGPKSHATSAPTATATTRATPTATVNSTGRDLALHRPASASASQGHPWGPANAVDGVADSRWSSAFSDPQWLTVDLGARWQISQIVVNWEHAYGTAYRLEVSTDGKTWRTVFSTTQGQGGDVTVRTNTAGRYVRLYGTHRSSQYGYSVYELEVR